MTHWLTPPPRLAAVRAQSLGIRRFLASSRSALSTRNVELAGAERDRFTISRARAQAPLAALAGLGGVVSTALDVAVLTALVESGCAVGPAAWIGTLAGAALAFGWNRRYVFGDRSALRWQQVACFALVALVGAVALALSMHVAVTLCGLPYLVAKAVCAVLVFAVWNLPAQRRFVFPSARPQTFAAAAVSSSRFPRSLDAGASSTSF
jgi:putative flippase GtrA